MSHDKSLNDVLLEKIEDFHGAIDKLADRIDNLETLSKKSKDRPDDAYETLIAKVKELEVRIFKMESEYKSILDKESDCDINKSIKSHADISKTLAHELYILSRDNKNLLGDMIRFFEHNFYEVIEKNHRDRMNKVEMILGSKFSSEAGKPKTAINEIANSYSEAPTNFAQSKEYEGDKPALECIDDDDNDYFEDISEADKGVTYDPDVNSDR